MTIWHVHRRADGTIASAHSEPQPGYADEVVDTEDSAELRALLAPPSVPPEPRAWLERLPADKQAAIMAAALANATVLLWVMKASGSVNIDVNDQEAKDGVAALVAAGVLTKDDAAVLLAP